MAPSASANTPGRALMRDTAFEKVEYWNVRWVFTGASSPEKVAASSHSRHGESTGRDTSQLCA
jgi:hypothetical protein